jgi:hypothetical protein
VAYENNEKKMESIYSKRIRAGKRRTYFFDVRATRGNDYYLTITESRKRFNDNGYDRHKIFLYKEDFNKFIKALNEAVDYVKTQLMPDFDFDAYNHEDYDDHDHDHDDHHDGGRHEVPRHEIAQEIAVASISPIILEEETPVEEPSEMPAASAATTSEEVDKW